MFSVLSHGRISRTKPFGRGGTTKSNKNRHFPLSLRVSPRAPNPLSLSPFADFLDPKDLLEHFSSFLGGVGRAELLVLYYRDFRAKATVWRFHGEVWLVHLNRDHPAKAKRGGKKASCGSEVNVLTVGAVKCDKRSP